MAAHNTPIHAHDGAQSLYQASLSPIAQQSEANTARQTACSPSHASSRTQDYRWKCGRPVTFSSRPFSTKRSDLNTQADAVTVKSTGPSIAGQAPGQLEAVAPLCWSKKHSEVSGDTATSECQDTCVKGSASEPYHSAPVQKDNAIDFSSSRQITKAHIALPSCTDTHSASRDTQNNTNTDLEVDMQLASLESSATNDVTDLDYMPISTDERGSQSEKDDSQADAAVEQGSGTHAPLEFQIPEDVLRAAMAAPENTRASFWSSNLYCGAEDRKILVHYCKTKEVAERVAQHFVKEKVVGFDIEWKPYAHPLSIKKNVSLIQLACEDRIALFHIALFSGQTAAQLMPPTLKAILESPEVFKVGVAVKGDFSRIVKYLEVEPQGVFELSRLHNLVQFSVTDPSKVTNKLVGLAAQVQQHLQLPLYKGGHLVDDPEDTSNVRSSDWSLPLNHQQIHYAAADAYAGFRLYDALEEKRKQLKPTPPRPQVCDYDSKPRPKSSDSKARKKRTAVASTDEAASAVAEETTMPTEREMEEEPEQSEDTEAYETAQEDLLDSHQLEGEDPAPSEESYDSTDESDDDVSINLATPLQSEGMTASTDAAQRRVGRINRSWFKGSDPGYPNLPKPRHTEGPYVTSDEDLVDISEKAEEGEFHHNVKPAKKPDVDDEIDEFDDPDLEAGLRGLAIDGEGNLQVTSANGATSNASPPQERQERPIPSVEMSEMAQASKENKIKDNILNVAAPLPLTGHNSHSRKKEQQLVDLLKDPYIVEYLHLHAPGQPTASSPSSVPPTSADSPPSQSPHTAEFDLATSWAQSYLASTIPSPASRAPSHIRATIPHLRAYHMWRYQALSLHEVARHLRDPPLAESTVGNYVLQAITLERMEYDNEDVKRVLMCMPAALRRGKWRGLAEKVGVR